MPAAGRPAGGVRGGSAPPPQYINTTTIITVTDDDTDTDTDDDADDTIYIQHHFTIHFNLNRGVITLINHSKVIKNGTKNVKISI